MPLHYLFDVATRYHGDVGLAISEDKPDFKIRGTAYLLDLKSKIQIRKFPVRYETPGFRLALSRDDRFCFAGCYDTYGLGAYSATSGEEVWRRKDLKSVQVVTASEVEDWVFCGRETGAAHLLEVSTGKTLEQFVGVKAMYPSPFDTSVIVAGKNFELHAPFGRKLATFKRTCKSEFSCAFSPTEVILNEPNSLRCFDLKTHDLLWTYHPPVEGKILRPRVWFCEVTGSFVWHPDVLMFFNARTGNLCREVKLAVRPGLVYGICWKGSALLASNLQLLSTETGALLADLSTAELLTWDPRASMDRFRELAASDRPAEELERYMVSEGFAKNDIDRVLLMKYSNETKKT